MHAFWYIYFPGSHFEYVHEANDRLYNPISDVLANQLLERVVRMEIHFAKFTRLCLSFFSMKPVEIS